MSWKSSKFASSLMSFFSDSGSDSSSTFCIEEVRQAMLDCMYSLEDSHRKARISAQVLYASDIQALWYLRSDVMNLLAALLGEAVAHARLALISDMFTGLLPAAQKARPNRLRR